MVLGAESKGTLHVVQEAEGTAEEARKKKCEGPMSSLISDHLDATSCFLKAPNSEIILWINQSADPLITLELSWYNRL